MPAGHALEVGARGEGDDSCHQKHHSQGRDRGYTPLPSRRRPRLVGRGGGDARWRPSLRIYLRFPQGVLEKAHTIPPYIANAERRIYICDTQETNRKSRLAIPGLSDSDSAARLTSLRPISAPPRKYAERNARSQSMLILLGTPFERRKIALAAPAGRKGRPAPPATPRRWSMYREVSFRVSGRISARTVTL